MEAEPLEDIQNPLSKTQRTILIRKINKAAKDLKKKGYAVIEEVFSSAECETLMEDMWKCLEKATNGVIRKDADFSKLKGPQLLPHKHGIIQAYRLNHAPFIRKVRRDLRIIEIYAALMGTDQLVASMDRINFKYPGRSYRSAEPWPHMDQDPRFPGLITIQSYLCLTDCEENSPGNRLYEGSHLVFAKRWAHLRKEGPTDSWRKLNETDASSLEEICPLIKPTMKKGSLLLWDSRVIHSPDDGTDFENGRFVIYLCFSKLWEKANDSAFLKKKQDAFLDCRATSHNPIPQKCFPKKCRVYDEEKKTAFMEFSKEDLNITDERIGAEEYLFGFKSYKRKEGLLLGKDWKEAWNTERKGKASLPLLQFTSPFNQKMLPVPKRKPEDMEIKNQRPKKKIKHT